MIIYPTTKQGLSIDTMNMKWEEHFHAVYGNDTPVQWPIPQGFINKIIAENTPTFNDNLILLNNPAVQLSGEQEFVTPIETMHLTEVIDDKIEELVASDGFKNANCNWDIKTVLGYRYFYDCTDQSLTRDENYYEPPQPMCKYFTTGEQTGTTVKVMSPKYKYNRTQTNFDSCSNRDFNREGKLVCQMRNKMQSCSGYEEIKDEVLYDFFSDEMGVWGKLSARVNTKGTKIFTVSVGMVKHSFSSESQAKDYINDLSPQAQLVAPKFIEEEITYSGYCASLIDA
jgi:hypothetical protein